MSLITLNSNGQIPHFFSCHFPQAIKIKPHSQVCLLKFLHFRDSNVFNITASNNRLVFLIGNSRQDAFRTVNIPIGQYTGPDLAALLTIEMNAVLQQQNYAWFVNYTAEDDTTSPPTNEAFEVILNSVVTPLPGALVFTIANPTQFRQVGQLLSVVPAQLDLALSNGRYVEPKGILIDDGEVIMHDMGYNFLSFFSNDLDQDITFTFNRQTMGIVRDEISSLTAENVNLQFNPQLQDVSIAFNLVGIEISMINIRPGPSTLGSPGYATRKLCRTIPASVLRRQLLQADYDLNSLANTRFRARLITKNGGRRVIITLQRSLDCGRVFTDLPNNTFGDDPQGFSYIAPFVTDVTYQSVIWVSDVNAFNDEVNGANQSKAAVMQTRKAPFHPTVNLEKENELMDYKQFISGTLFYNKVAGGTDVSPDDYTGPNAGYKVTWVDVGAANKEYYCVPDTVRNPTTFTNVNLWHVSETDVPITPALPMSTFLYDIATNTGTITHINPAVADLVFILDQAISQGVPMYLKRRNVPIVTGGIVNPVLRPLTNMRVLNADSSPKSREEMHKDVFAGEDFINDVEVDNLGADVQRPVSLLLKMLNNEDIASNAAAPLYLTQNVTAKFTGTIGGIMGSNNNLISVASGTFPMAIYATDGVCQKISKDTIINISINEFSGLKSFNGIDQSVGKNLSGEGKVLAVLPREEFSTANIEKEGSLVYVSPFENWLDINNGQELLLNQLTVEVRTPAGEMATDLRPDTICQIKIREDPHKVAEIIANDGYTRLISAMSSATNSGQILNSSM